MDVERHREEIRRLVAEAPDEPTYCEFKQLLTYAIKKEKGELVKDVSSFANTDLEALGGYGYIIFGVTNDGRVMGIGTSVGDPASAIRQIVNGHLDRPVNFEYVTCEVDDKVGGKKRVAAIVVPNSKRRPHVVSKEIKERLNNRDIFWLREREVWVRKTGGRELATAEDLDAMYEGKLRRLVDDQVRPLQQRVERLEGDLREQRSLVPELGFGFANLSDTGPSPSGRPNAILGNLIDTEQIHAEIEWATDKARSTRSTGEPWGIRLSSSEPSSGDYAEHAQALEAWMSTLQELLFVDFVLINTGRTPAEDVKVTLRLPAGLSAGEELPEKPEPPRGIFGRNFAAPRLAISKHSSPDSLIGPDIYDVGSGEAAAVWEVGKLYHGRPLFTSSDLEEVGGLLISLRKCEELLHRSPDGIRLDYVVHAANLPEAHRGSVVLR